MSYRAGVQKFLSERIPQTVESLRGEDVPTSRRAHQPYLCCSDPLINRDYLGPMNKANSDTLKCPYTPMVVLTLNSGF